MVSCHYLVSATFARFATLLDPSNSQNGIATFPICTVATYAAGERTA